MLEGGLFFVPLNHKIASIAIGGLPVSGRAVAECLAGSRLQSVASFPEVLVVADPPHQGQGELPCLRTITFTCGRWVFAR